MELIVYGSQTVSIAQFVLERLVESDPTRVAYRKFKHELVEIQ